MDSLIRILYVFNTDYFEIVCGFFCFTYLITNAAVIEAFGGVSTIKCNKES